MEARCIPVSFCYRQDPPETDWWVMASQANPFGIEDQLPVLADTDWWVPEPPPPLPTLKKPGVFEHREENGQIIITIHVPCDEQGNIESALRLAYEHKADEIFWNLYPEAELV